MVLEKPASSVFCNECLTGRGFAGNLLLFLDRMDVQASKTQK
jgi:hypothetical protein